jgi:phi13 family phage major tail protein
MNGKAYAIGLRDLYFAKLKADGTYDVPAKLSEAITATITPNYTITTMYGDDRAVAVAGALGDIDVSITTSDISDSDYDLLMGTTKNADGVIEDSIENIAPYGALGFRLPLEGGGFRYFWYYKGKFQPPAANHQTKGNSVEFQNPQITGKFVTRDDGKWRARFTHDSGTASTVATNWFTSVYTPTPEV